MSRRRTRAVVAFACVGAMVLTVAPVSAADEVRDTLDTTADSADEQVNAAACEGWSRAWPTGSECGIGPEAEYRCVLQGETTSVEPGADGLRYTLGGEVECRQDGRIVRTIHGTFRTGPGLVTRTCENTWCERRGAPYDAYATASHEPRCVYSFDGPSGHSAAPPNLYERSSAPPDAGNPRLAVFVDLPEEKARFRADDFSIANGDGIGTHRGGPQATASPWVLDDGVPGNGWSEGVVDLRVTMHEHAAGLSTGDPLVNCLPTDELSGFSVEGSLEFVVGEESLFRPPSQS